MLRRVCIVTGSRAEWGIVRFLVQRLHEAPDFELTLVATGTHPSPEFGLTIREIESDGVPISVVTEMLVSSDSSVGTAKSVGLGVSGLADAFQRLRPDIVLLCGDRFEMLAAASAALLMRIPIAHIHGGETTRGSLDEGIRHAITKMAHLHFVAALAYRDRVIQMGEDPSRVYHVGAPVLDSIGSLELLGASEVEDFLGVELRGPVFLITYHPETAGESRPKQDIDELLLALDEFPDATIIFTAANADAGGRAINSRIQRFAEGAPASRVFATSLGQHRYFSVLARADLVIGNSSSALIEAPFFEVPCVNVGGRQAGRARGRSVFDCPCDASAIAHSMRQVLTLAREGLIDFSASPYGKGGASESILSILRGISVDQLGPKVFRDLPRAHLD